MGWGVQVVTITGPDQHNLLLRLTGALNSLNLNIVSASISSSEDGTVFDVFRISNREDQKVRHWQKVAHAWAALACMHTVVKDAAVAELINRTC
jgi:UTP:GlnB (protein PII) uridylyltransferase